MDQEYQPCNCFYLVDPNFHSPVLFFCWIVDLTFKNKQIGTKEPIL